MTRPRSDYGIVWPKKIDGQTRQKLWANSKPPETARLLAEPMTKAEAALYLDHLGNYAARLPRLKGSGWGELTSKFTDVARALVALRSRSGLITPSYREIALKARCSMATVYRAIKVLVHHGFLQYARRWRVASRPDQVVEQDTNAYRLLIPQAARKLLANFREGLNMRLVPERLPGRRRIVRVSDTLEMEIGLARSLGLCPS